MRHYGFQIRDVAVEMETNHSSRDIVTKLLELFFDISHKGITVQSPNHHDCVDWTLLFSSIVFYVMMFIGAKSTPKI